MAIAAMQWFHGRDPASLRFRDLDHDSIDLVVAEEQSRDAERGHITENVSLRVAPEGACELLLARGGAPALSWPP